MPATLFVLGWVLQFVGHAVEGKPPEFFKDPRFLLVGLRWWLAKMRGKGRATAIHEYLSLNQGSALLE